MANNRVLRAGESGDNIGTDWSYAPPAGGYTNSTADVAIKAAVTLKKNYLTSIEVSIGVALANATELVIKDGAAIVYRCSLPVTAGVHPPIYFDPPLRNAAVNTAFNIAAVTLFATGNLTLNAQGYTV